MRNDASPWIIAKVWGRRWTTGVVSVDKTGLGVRTEWTRISDKQGDISFRSSLSTHVIRNEVDNND